MTPFMTTLAAAGASAAANLTSAHPPHPVAPVAYDFAYCHPYYGLELRRAEAQYAGSILPQGADLQAYYINDPMAPFHLPLTVTYGGIQLTVEAAISMTAAAFQYVTVTPNELRGMAGYVTQACVNNQGRGGFITRRFSDLVNYALLPDIQLQHVPYPGDTIFLTLTIMALGLDPSPAPGDFDPEIPRRLGQAEAAAYRRETTAPANLRQQFVDRSKMLGIQAVNMRRTLKRPWWMFRYTNEGDGTNSPGDAATNITFIDQLLDKNDGQDSADVSPTAID